MIILKWFLVTYFGLIVLLQTYMAAERKDPVKTRPSSKAFSAVIHLGFIYWILEVM